MGLDSKTRTGRCPKDTEVFVKWMVLVWFVVAASEDAAINSIRGRFRESFSYGMTSWRTYSSNLPHARTQI